MIVKLTAKRQVTFPARVLDELGVRPGDHLQLEESPDGWLLRPRRVDENLLGGLRDKVASGQAPFDLSSYRTSGYGPEIRD